MANAIGQMFNALKEQTPLVVYSYRTDQIAARRARRLRGGAQPGADRPADHQVHLARAPARHDPGDHPPRLQGGVDAALRPRLHLLAFRLTTTSACAPRSSPQDLVDPRMRVRPNPDDVQRAAKLLVEARMPLMVVGDEIYKAKAAAKAVKLAELLGMPVTQVRQLYANFPETHPLWVGNLAGGNLNSLQLSRRAPTSSSMSATSSSTTAPAPIVPRGPKFIDMRIDHWQHGQRHAHRGAAGLPTSATGSTT